MFQHDPARPPADDLPPRLLPRRVAVTLAGMGAVALVGLADRATGAEIGFTLLYLGPIALVGWYAGPGPALLTAAASAADWLLADLAKRPAYATSFARWWNLGVETGVFLLFAALVAALRSRLDRESAAARRDALTGLANRRGFLEATEQELKRAHRYGRPFGVAYIDVDGFKAVNDRLGHRAGDELLRSAGILLRNGIRANDVAARIGGDEFGLLLPETPPQAGQRLLRRLLDLLRAEMQARGSPVTFSAGLASFVAVAGDLAVDHVLHRADGLMYSAKATGGDRLVHEVLGAPPQEETAPSTFGGGDPPAR